MTLPIAKRFLLLVACRMSSRSLATLGTTRFPSTEGPSPEGLDATDSITASGLPSWAPSSHVSTLRIFLLTASNCSRLPSYLILHILQVCHIFQFHPISACHGARQQSDFSRHRRERNQDLCVGPWKTGDGCE